VKSKNSDALTGIYIVDDMLPQPNWPSDHASHAAALLGTLNELSGFVTTPLSWATGVVLCVRASRDTPM
jgi:hypothetical protein